MEETPNLSYIDNLAKGDTLFAKNLMDIIKKELSAEIETYQFHLKQGDFIKTSEGVHKLSHKIGILGLEKGYKIAKEYEIDLLEKNLNLRSDFEHILDAMLLFIEKV